MIKQKNKFYNHQNCDVFYEYTPNKPIIKNNKDLCNNTLIKYILEEKELKFDIFRIETYGYTLEELDH